MPGAVAAPLDRKLVDANPPVVSGAAVVPGAPELLTSAAPLPRQPGLPAAQGA